jgi:hypothetical protein
VNQQLPVVTLTEPGVVVSQYKRYKRARKTGRWRRKLVFEHFTRRSDSVPGVVNIQYLWS